MWILGARVLRQHREDEARFQESTIQLHRPIFPGDADADAYADADANAYTFLSNILRKPRRALYVRNLLVEDGNVVDCIRLRALKAANRELISVMLDEPCGLLFRGIVECPYIQDNASSEWAANFRRGDTYEAAFLALTLLPNLEVLSLEYLKGGRFAELIYGVLTTNQSPLCKILGPLPLHKLHTVIIDETTRFSQPHERYGFYEISLMLPSLRKLHAKRTVSDFDKWPSVDEFSIESKVTDIVFDRSSISAESFARLFSRTKCLQRLRYEFLNWAHGHGDHTPMSFKETLEQYTAHTLTHLDLDFRVIMGRGFVGSLRQFQTLKHLRIQGNMFQRYPPLPEDSTIVDILPSLPASIETVTLLPQNEDPTTTYTLNELPKKREEYVPNLAKITCESNFPFVDEMFDECARVGIELVYM